MKIKATIVLAMFSMATVLSACSSEEELESYCVNQEGVVVDENFCDPEDADFDPLFLLWYSDDDHKYKKGKKIPSADFRKGKTSVPSASQSAKPKTGQSSTKPKDGNGMTSKPKVNTGSSSKVGSSTRKSK